MEISVMAPDYPDYADYARITCGSFLRSYRSTTRRVSNCFLMETAGTGRPTLPARVMQKASFSTVPSKPGIGGLRMCVVGLFPPAMNTLFFSMKTGSLFWAPARRSEEHTSELQSRLHLVCR